MLTDTDSSQRVVDVATGKRSNVQLNVLVNFGLVNYFSVNDDALARSNANLKVDFAPELSHDGSSAPVIRASLSRARKITISGGALINGAEVEIPTFTVVAPSGRTFEVKYSASGFTVFTADEPGVWYISAEYTTLFGADQVPQPPYNGGGGGVGVVAED